MQREDLEEYLKFGIIRGERLQWKNPKGELVLAMKSKKQYGYWVFEVYPERVGKERRELFDAVWGAIKWKAASLGIPLYEMSEITLLGNKGLEIWIKKNPGKEPPVWPEQIDVDIPIYDHAADRYGKLTVGISVADEKTERQVRDEE